MLVLQVDVEQPHNQVLCLTYFILVKDYRTVRKCFNKVHTRRTLDVVWFSYDGSHIYKEQ